MYSREDILEQYCINRKELQVFQDNVYHHQGGLFGCLSTSNLVDQNSCNKNYLLSCMQPTKYATDVGEDDDDERFYTKNDKLSNYCDDDDSDGGFRRKTTSRAIAIVNRKSWSKRCDPRANSKNIDQTKSSQMLVDKNAAQCLTGDYSKNYKQSSLDQDKNLHQYDDENARIGQTQSYQQSSSNNQWPNSRVISSKSPHVQLIAGNDERLMKHVQFDSSSLVRSNTVCSGLVASSSQQQPSSSYITKHVNNPHNLSPTCQSVDQPQLINNNLTHERLIHATSNRPLSGILTTSILTTNPRFNQNVSQSDLASSSSCLYNQVNRSNSAVNFNSTARHFDSRRRTVCRTQATQTDSILSRSIPCIPAYLTLSPRACTYRRATSMRGRRVPRAECHSETGSLYQSSSENRSRFDSESEEDFIALRNESSVDLRMKDNNYHNRADDACWAYNMQQYELMVMMKNRQLYAQKNHLISPNNVKDFTRLSDSSKQSTKYQAFESNIYQNDAKLSSKIAYKSYSYHDIDGELSKSLTCNHDTNNDARLDKKDDKEDDKDAICGEIRRHSVAADFLTDSNLLLYPPPGFEDANNDKPEEIIKSSSPLTTSPIASSSGITMPPIVDTNCCLQKEISESSSSNTNKAVYLNNYQDEHSLFDCDDIDSRLNSDDTSPTIISEISSNILSEEVDQNSCKIIKSLPVYGASTSAINGENNSDKKLSSQPLHNQAQSSKSNQPTCSTKFTQHELISQESESSSRVSIEPSSLSSKSGLSASSETTTTTSTGMSMDKSDAIKEPDEKKECNWMRVDNEEKDKLMQSVNDDDEHVELRRRSASLNEDQEAVDSCYKENRSNSLLSPANSCFTLKRNKNRPKDKNNNNHFQSETFITYSPASSSNQLPSESDASFCMHKSVDHSDDYDSDRIASSSTPIHDTGSSDISTAPETGNTVVEHVNHGKMFTYKEIVRKEDEKLDENDDNKSQLVEKVKDDNEKIVGQEEDKISLIEQDNVFTNSGENNNNSTLSSTQLIYLSSDNNTLNRDDESAVSEDLHTFPVESVPEMSMDHVDFFCAQALSTELSTVSEVSEEISNQKSELHSSKVSSSSSSPSSASPSSSSSSSSSSSPSSSSSAFAPGLHQQESNDDNTLDNNKSFELEDAEFENVAQSADNDDKNDPTDASSPSSFSSHIDFIKSNSIKEDEDEDDVYPCFSIISPKLTESIPTKDEHVNVQVQNNQLPNQCTTSPTNIDQCETKQKNNNKSNSIQNFNLNLDKDIDCATGSVELLPVESPVTAAAPTIVDKMSADYCQEIIDTKMVNNSDSNGDDKKFKLISKESIDGSGAIIKDTQSLSSEGGVYDKLNTDGKSNELNKDEIGGESSQATEHDLARLEFSLTQQSSQEIDEESLSMFSHFGEKSADIIATNKSINISSTRSIPGLSTSNDVGHNRMDEKISSREKMRMSRAINDEMEILCKSIDAEDDKSNNNNNDNSKKSISSKNSAKQLERQSFDEVKSESDKSLPTSASVNKVNKLATNDVKLIDSDVRKNRCKIKAFTKPEQRSASSGDAPINDMINIIASTAASSSSSSLSSCLHRQPHSSNYPNSSSSAARNRSEHRLSYRKSFTIEDMKMSSSNKKDDDEDVGVYSDAYKRGTWFFIAPKDELRVWSQRQMSKDASSSSASLDHPTPLSSEISTNYSDNQINPSDSLKSTKSEKAFGRHYDAVTHRMIHRRASIELYTRIRENNFVIEKNVFVIRNSGEFGFRIHGSRPVVVSAIEKGTPAESCGLEVGDIIVTVNDENVLDASHSEVVRLAHAGSNTLKLQLVPTCQKLKEWQKALDDKPEDDEIFSGFLYRRSNPANHDDGNLPNNSHKTGHLWKRRWFILKSDCCLCWYKQPNDGKLVGVINLQNYTASFVQSSSSESKYILCLSNNCGESSCLYATDEMMATRWLNCINAAASRVSRNNPYIEKSLQNIHIQPGNIDNPDCDGYLHIYGHQKKLWKQRFFLLKDACLYSYSDVSSTTALGVFYLQGCKVQSITLMAKRNTLEILSTDRKIKRLWLMADTEIDKKRWLAALEYSIDRWIRLN